MNFFLQWIAPPLVGAVIGYVTNAIAIKMLFRPLTEKRVFGLRVPFTPGILPMQRHKLAVNIGNMVSRELLTESIVRDRLRTAEFRSLVERSVAGYTEKLLSSSISQAASSASDFGRSVGAVVERFVVSDSFSNLVRSVVRRAVDKIGARTLSDLFVDSSGAFPDLSSLLERLLGSLSNRETEKRIADAVESFLRTRAEEGNPLGSYLPDTVASDAARLADLLYPAVVDAVVRFLNERDTRIELEAKGKVILRDAIMELNAFQRFFVSAAQYDKTLNDRMPAIVDGVVERIEETARTDQTRIRFIETVRTGVEDILSKPVDDALSGLKTDRPSLSRSIAKGVVAVAGSPASRSSLHGLLAGLFSALEKEPLERIARDRLGLDPSALADMAAYSLVAYVRAECGEAVPRLIDGFLRQHGSDQVSMFLGVDDAEKAKWDLVIAEKVLAMFDERIAAVIDSLDVRTMVSDRIDSLDMEDVERIVLDVLAGQLKWIDIFGAFLGALMGLFQSLLAVLIAR